MLLLDTTPAATQWWDNVTSAAIVGAVVTAVATIAIQMLRAARRERDKLLRMLCLVLDELLQHRGQLALFIDRNMWRWLRRNAPARPDPIAVKDGVPILRDEVFSDYRRDLLYYEHFVSLAAYYRTVRRLNGWDRRLLAGNPDDQVDFMRDAIALFQSTIAAIDLILAERDIKKHLEGRLSENVSVYSDDASRTREKVLILMALSRLHDIQEIVNLLTAPPDPHGIGVSQSLGSTATTYAKQLLALARTADSHVTADSLEQLLKPPTP